MTTNTVKNSFAHKFAGLETNFQQCFYDIKDLINDFKELTLQLETCQNEVDLQKEKCSSQNCSSSEALKKVIASKDNIIQLVALSLSKLSETKNLEIRKELFEIIYGDSELRASKQISQLNRSPKDTKTVIKQELSLSYTEEVTCKDESVSEIEGTPTGRTSPIIQTKKRKTRLSVDIKDNCLSDWQSQENKSVKLLFHTPSRRGSGKLRQSRLNLVNVKQAKTIDLTCSPANTGLDKERSDYQHKFEIKKECLENDDTILPSPTSGQSLNSNLCKISIKNSPSKIKKPLSLTTMKREKKEQKEDTVLKDVTNMDLGESINILNPLHDRFVMNKTPSPRKMEQIEDMTQCGTEQSMSLLNNQSKLEFKQIEHSTHNRFQDSSLTNNNNANNIIEGDIDLESSLSLLDKDRVAKKLAAQDETLQRVTACKVENVFLEPVVRKKIDKAALPGWSCEECKNFYAELYADNIEMLAAKMDECSKHRGRTNPEKPKVPPNFWNPRWSVPSDTEEFNRRNNAV